MFILRLCVLRRRLVDAIVFVMDRDYDRFEARCVIVVGSKYIELTWSRNHPLDSPQAGEM